MLLSMTGQGQGRRPFDQNEITVEVRAVNNRFLKIQTRVSDVISGLEPQIESVVKQSLRRGSLQIGVFLSGRSVASEYCLQESVLESYFHQCTALATKLGIVSGVTVAGLLMLPGVVGENGGRLNSVEETLAAMVLATVADAMESLNRMRLSEGQSMRSELEQQVVKLREITIQIERRAPTVIEEYRQRLHGRLAQSLADIGGQIQETDLVREILLMADKADIREEVVRLRSHFLQFETLLDDASNQGRKLDFLIQEIFREVNTIGSKAGDAEIAQRVVEMKSIVEQMRELVQNVE